MALRVEVPYNARRASGTAVPGSTLHIYLRATTTQVTVYSGETGGSTLTQPLVADANGEFTGWVDPDQLDVKLTMDSVASTVAWDASPGGALVGLAEPTLKVIRGIIDTSGSGTILEGAGYTITRNGTGDITVTFSVAFSDLPTVTSMAGTAGNLVAKLGAATTTTTARIVVFASNTGTNTDGTLHFIAIGPS